MCQICWEREGEVLKKGSAHHFLTRIAVERTAVPSMTAARIPIMVNVAELMPRVRITSHTPRDQQITHLLQMLLRLLLLPGLL